MRIDGRLRSRVLVGLVVALVVTASPAAAGSEKAAIKQFTTAAKTRLGLFASALDGARVTVLARADAFDVAVQTNGVTVADVQGLVDDLAAFQAAVEDGLFDVAVDTAADGKAALVASRTADRSLRSRRRLPTCPAACRTRCTGRSPSSSRRPTER
jgi:hypothetical protein